MKCLRTYEDRKKTVFEIKCAPQVPTGANKTESKIIRLSRRARSFLCSLVSPRPSILGHQRIHQLKRECAQLVDGAKTANKTGKRFQVKRSIEGKYWPHANLKCSQSPENRVPWFETVDTMLSG
jgi:hypothetical protein